MRPPIDDGVVLLTGASSGIGLEMARLLAPRAKKLILVARRKERLDALAEELADAKAEVQVRPCDLSDLNATAQLADEVGEVDVLINNAGFGDLTLFEKADWEKTKRMLRVNVDALVLLTHKMLPAMLERGRGGVLNVSSGWGLFFCPGFAGYVGTKHFVTGFTESLRLEVKGRGVVVTQVCPGPVDTEFDAVTGNPTGHSVPSIINQSPAQCAKRSIAGFDRGRAIVYPGLLLSLFFRLGTYVPRWIMRLALTPVAPMLKKKQEQTA